MLHLVLTNLHFINGVEAQTVLVTCLTSCSYYVLEFETWTTNSLLLNSTFPYSQLLPWWNGNPLQYSCLENPMDGGACSSTVHRVAKSQTRSSDFTSFHFILLSRLRTFLAWHNTSYKKLLWRAADRRGLTQQHLLSQNCIPSCIQVTGPEWSSARGQWIADQE